MDDGPASGGLFLDIAALIAAITAPDGTERQRARAPAGLTERDERPSWYSRNAVPIVGVFQLGRIVVALKGRIGEGLCCRLKRFLEVAFIALSGFDEKKAG